MASWSKDFLLGFIEKYRTHECIWKIKSKEYHNRAMKEAAYNDLVAYVRTVENRATKETVLKKINNLRSSFRKEVKKVNCSQKSGGLEDAYVPKLWYFNDLLFLLDQEEAQDGSDQEEFNTESSSADQNMFSLQTTPSQQSSTHQSSMSAVQHISSQQADLSLGLLCGTPTPQADTSTNFSSYGRQPCKRACILTPCEEMLVSVGQRLQEFQQEDRFDVFGKNIAQKLRVLGVQQRIFAEKLINDALFEAELGSLHRNASINPGFPVDSRPAYSERSKRN